MILKNLLFLLLFILLVLFFIISLPYFYFFEFKYKKQFQYQIHIKVAFFKLKYFNLKNHSKTIISIFNYQKEIKNIFKEKTEKNVATINNKKHEENKFTPNFPISIITKKNITHLLNFLIN